MCLCRGSSSVDNNGLPRETNKALCHMGMESQSPQVCLTSGPCAASDTGTCQVLAEGFSPSLDARELQVHLHPGSFWEFVARV